MSNRFKFRAWNGEGMEYGGFEIHPTAGHIHPHPQLSCLKVDSPLMQFTGLVDSKGVDIYESDVLGMPRVDDSGVSPSSVVFEDGSFFKNYPGWDDSLSKPRLDKSGIKVLKLEVIGNCHANPELMEQQA